LNWERENQRLLDFYRDIRKDHGGEDSELDNEEFQIIDNLEELDDQIIKRKRDELEKAEEGLVENDKANLLKKEVKMENEMEFELKTLNLGDINFGTKGKKSLPFQDITGEPDFQVEEEEEKKKNQKKKLTVDKKKTLKANTKIAISSTLDLHSIKKEVEKQTHARTMNMHWNKIELDEVKEEIKDEFQKDDELVDFDIDDDKIDRMDNDKE